VAAWCNTAAYSRCGSLAGFWRVARGLPDRLDRKAAGPLIPGVELAELVKRVAINRDREAFIVLFDHFAPRLNGYLVRMGTDAALAEEIAQDALATLWRKAALFDPAKSSVSTWLYRVARNRRIDLARRDRSGRIDQEDPSLLPVEPESLDDQIDAQQREDAVRNALAILPQEQLDLVKLAFFAGKSHSDIAIETGLPLGTVKSRLRLAFTRLRRQLESQGVVGAS
jgi:RNA polymerase sigma factor (sigma-70 family)